MLDATHSSSLAGSDTPSAEPPREATRLSELTPHQWKAGIAAWLGWLFDGLDMHLYTFVAIPFVAELMRTSAADPAVGHRSSWIQAAFLFGWAFGGSMFGVIGDRIGRTRALILTILTYAIFTGLSYFAREWWHLLIFRFVAALGIGGEWAVGASLLSETWPKRWRPWMAAVLQTAVNCGILLASLAFFFMAGGAPRNVFLLGVVPALLVLWIRKAVPETEEWHQARAESRHESPRLLDLFRGSLRRTSSLILAVCALSLTAHWAFVFWCSQHLRQLLTAEAMPKARQDVVVSQAMTLMMVTAIAGNFLAAAVARRFGYRRTIAVNCLAYFATMMGAYGVARSADELIWWIAGLGLCQGMFALFTMYLPPLFPTLLRTTGAGFCYNFGRCIAAFGTVFFGLFNKVGDFRTALVLAGVLFLPAAGVAWLLPEASDETLPPPVPLAE